MLRQRFRCVKRGKNKVTATERQRSEFRICGTLLYGRQMEINSKAEVSVKNAKKQIQKYRNLQRAGRDNFMDVSYRRDKDHNYMILDARGTDREEYQVRMLVEIIFLIY